MVQSSLSKGLTVFNQEHFWKLGQIQSVNPSMDEKERMEAVAFDCSVSVI